MPCLLFYPPNLKYTIVSTALFTAPEAGVSNDNAVSSVSDGSGKGVKAKILDAEAGKGGKAAYSHKKRLRAAALYIPFDFSIADTLCKIGMCQEKI